MKQLSESRWRLASRLAIGLAMATSLACLGGNCFKSDEEIAREHRQLIELAMGTTRGQAVEPSSGDQVNVDFGGRVSQAHLPSGTSVGQGQVVVGYEPGTAFFRNATLRSSISSITLLNLDTLQGGVVPSAGLSQSGSDVVINRALAFPPGRYKLQIDGEVLWQNLLLYRMIYLFMVFNDGTSSLPLSASGLFPAPGFPATAFQMAMLGFLVTLHGNAAMMLTMDGQNPVTRTATKAAGSTTVDFNFDPIATPSGGIREMRFDFTSLAQ